MSWSGTRREVLELGGGVLFVVGCGENLALDLVDGNSFDLFLDRVHATDASLDGGGLSNHAPMAAEALVSLGRDDLVIRFANDYAADRDLVSLAPALPLSEAERTASLGNDDRARWIATYVDDLASMDPIEVLARDWATLCRGWAAAGFHGLLRTAHAMRSLDRSDTESRRREVAHGLGYWAAKHFPLAGEPGVRSEPGLDVVAALERVALVPEERRTGGLIVEALSPAADDSALAAVVETVDLDALPVDAAITELCAAAARLFVSGGSRDIYSLHAITSCSALRLLLPWLDAPSQRLGLGYAFQGVAAVHSVRSAASGVPASTAPSSMDSDALQDRAVVSSDEHTIKLVETCIREHSIDPRPELLAAAEGWLAG